MAWLLLTSDHISTAPTGLVDASVTLPVAPWLERVVGKVDTGALTVQTQSAPSFIDLAGSIILPPGAYLAIFTSTASAAAGFIGSIGWTEVPI